MDKNLIQLSEFSIHVRWVPHHRGMARPQVADGEEGFEIWMVVANILCKQSRRADTGGSSNWGGGSAGG
jgi:hypothetical protein